MSTALSFPNLPLALANWVLVHPSLVCLPHVFHDLVDRGQSLPYEFALSVADGHVT